MIVACVALVGLLAYGLASKGADTSIDESLARGQRPETPALGRELPVLGEQGGSGSPADYRGKVVVLNFWASWCDPCKEELPLLQRAHERIEPDGGLVLGIDSRDFTDKALETVARYDLAFPNLRDANADLAREFGYTGLPETFVLDRQGRIAAKRRGPITQQWLDATLPPLLEETA